MAEDFEFTDQLDEMLEKGADDFLRSYAEEFAFDFVSRQEFELFLNQYAGMDLLPLVVDYLDTAHWAHDTKERVLDCLARTGLSKKLDGMDNPLDCAIMRGYDAEGIDFSAGEMQKIALARALYKDAPFVILDEPTAALDPIAEAAVYESFNESVVNKTAVFISHRLSSCRFCDDIAVFDAGKLVQQGSHEALIANEEGKYSKLWHAQAQYYTQG